MSVLIVDYGVGNLASVRRSLEECGASVWISEKPAEVHDATHIVLPGVGSFADAMRKLDGRGWIPHLRQAAIKEGIPLLGICLGMQLLADSGEEGENGKVIPGLGLIGGVVQRLLPTHNSERIPHVGWNEVYPEAASSSRALFSGISAGADFYFVHSFHFKPKSAESILSHTPYCGGFVSAVGHGNVVGVQFHPEKSSRYGLQLLRNFLTLETENYA